jgi:hypothetical protein
VPTTALPRVERLDCSKDVNVEATYLGVVKSEGTPLAIKRAETAGNLSPSVYLLKADGGNAESLTEAPQGPVALHESPHVTHAFPWAYLNV